MLAKTLGSGTSSTLLSEYASALGDATLRQRAHVAEHSARVEAELASQLKSEFIANMGRELRAPLNTIVGFSRLLMEYKDSDPSPENVVQYSKMITDEAQHLLAIINDILEVSKIQSGRCKIDKRPLDIEDILSSCMSLLLPESKKCDVHLNCTIDRNVPIVNGDAFRLTQIFTKVISSAVQRGPKGCRVEVHAKTSHAEGACVTIDDNSDGLSDEEMALVLTPFHLTEMDRWRKREGTGFELAIAKALAELHDADFQMINKDEGAMQIVIEFPAPVPALCRVAEMNAA